MTRPELEAAMLAIYLADTGKTMVADPAGRIHKMAEPAWQEIERLRKAKRQKRQSDSGPPA